MIVEKTNTPNIVKCSFLTKEKKWVEELRPTYEAMQKEIANLKDKLTTTEEKIKGENLLQEEIASLKFELEKSQAKYLLAEDKLHRRNMLTNNLRAELQQEKDNASTYIHKYGEAVKQIAEFKKHSINYNTTAQAILYKAILWLQGQEVENPMKGLEGFDCDAMQEATEAINKVVSL